MQAPPTDAGPTELTAEHQLFDTRTTAQRLSSGRKARMLWSAWAYSLETAGGEEGASVGRGGAMCCFFWLDWPSQSSSACLRLMVCGFSKSVQKAIETVQRCLFFPSHFLEHTLILTFDAFIDLYYHIVFLRACHVHGLGALFVFCVCASKQRQTRNHKHVFRANSRSPIKCCHFHCIPSTIG